MVWADRTTKGQRIMNPLTKNEYETLLALEENLFICVESIKPHERRALNRLVKKGYAQFNAEKQQWESMWLRVI